MGIRIVEVTSPTINPKAQWEDLLFRRRERLSVSSTDREPVGSKFNQSSYHNRKIKRTKGKYRSIALQNRDLYCFGVTIVGSPLPAPPRNAASFTQLSNFLSQVYVRM